MKTILIVDDIFENLYLLRVLLEKEGYTVIEANDGKAALDKLEDNTVDLIISDILMPVMDGYMFCQACKKDKRFEAIPFVFYTSTYTEKTDEDFGLKLGAAHFLRKPTDPDKILDLIQTLLETDSTAEKPKIKEEFTEQEVLKLYSKRLISKLEQKNQDLEKEIFEREKVELKLINENAILDLIANNKPIKEVFNHIINNYEASRPGLYVSISLLEDDGVHLNFISGPSLPKAYAKAIKRLVIGKSVGSCGTAAFTKKAIIVADISKHALWVNYRDLAKKHNLKSCWSTPILSEKNKVLGTFAIYSNAIKTPTLGNIKELNSAVNLAKIAIVKFNIMAEIKKRDESYKILVNHASDAILTYSFDGKIHSFNRATYTKLGYTLKEFSKLQLKDIVVGPIIESEVHYNKLMSGVSVIFEKKLICKDGTILNIEVSAKREKENRILSIARDITERKKAEIRLLESEHNLRQSQIVANIGSFTIDLKSDSWESSAVLDDIFGIDQHYIRDKDGWGKIIHPDQREEILEHFENCIQNRKKINIEYKAIKINTEKEIWVHAIGELLFDSNTNPIKIIGTTQDITERKKAEVKLQESEYNLRQSQAVANIGTFSFDMVSKTWKCSKVLDDIYGFKNQKIKIVDDWVSIIHPEDKEEVLNHFEQNVLVKGERFNKEYRIIRKDNNKIVWVHGFGELVLDSLGVPFKVIGTTQDINDRKKAEIKLLESEYILRQSQIVGNIGSYALELDTMTWTSSDVLDKILGIDKSYVKTVQSWGDLMHIEERKKLLEYFDYCVKNNKKFSREYRVVRVIDNKNIWVLGVGELLFDKEANPIKFIGTMQDITSRKESEIIIQESEKSLRLAQKIAKIGSFNLDLKNLVSENSNTFNDIIGIPYDKPVDFKLWQSIVHPEDRLIIKEALISSQKSDHKFDLEYRILTKDKKELKWIHGLGEVICNHEKPVSFIGTIQDITSRKQSELKLQESEYNLRQSQIVANIGSYTVDLNTMTWKGSAILGRLFGIQKKHPKTMEGWGSLIHPEDRKGMLTYIEEGIINNIKFNKEYRILRLDTKQEVWVHGIGELVYDSEGRAVQIIGTMQDVTQRKLSEVKIQESAKALQEAQKIAKTGSFKLFIKTLIGETSNTFNEILGIDYDAEINFELWKSIVHPDDRVLIKEAVVKSQLLKQKFNLEYRVYTKNNKELKWIHGLGEIVYDNGVAVSFVGTIQDITERKKAEIELKIVNEFTESLVMSMQEGLLMVDLEGTIIRVNESYCNMLGYSNEELIGMELPYPFAQEKDYKRMMEIKDLVTQGKAPSFQLEFVRKNGSKFIASFLAGLIRNDNDEVIAIFASVKDVSEDEKLKETLKEIAIKSTQKKEVILQLANLVGQDFNTSLNKITELSAKTLNIERVSVWSFNDGKDQLTCQKLYTLASNSYQSGYSMSYKDSPKYFKTLSKNHALLVSDAQKDAITKSINKDYLVPNNITSIMDVFINSANGYYGVICFENVGLPLKKWAPEDQEFATSIASIVSLILESTERKVAESNLKLEKEFSEELITSLHDGLSVVDLDGVHIKVNVALCNMTGFSEDELLGIKAPFPYWPPEEYENIYNAFNNPIQSFGSNKRFVLMRKNGERFPASFSDSVIKNKDGEIEAYFTTITDISLRVKAENVLKENIIRSDQRKNIIIKLASLIGEDFDLSLQKIAETSAKALDVDLVTIWKYKKGKTELLSKLFYNRLNQEFQKEKLIIKQVNFPHYFSVFENKNSINISDVVNNPITKSFSEEFFIPYNISSRIDVVIYGRHDNYGIISFESTIPKRVFSNEDESFATSIASIVSLLVESKERTIAENRIAKANKQLIEANKELTTLRNQLEQENVYLRNELDLVFNYEEMVYGSVEFSNVLNEIEKVAPTKATVLLQGESGTGKELLARAIHNTSTRNKKPLIKVNCSAIPRELIESELFGHKKGSFTGAFSDKVGKFELADGGTLFLDEIGELPLDMQPKILRFLQEGEIEVVGGAVSKKIDARVIAATNRNLVEEIQKKQFREDLYFRLNVFPIDVPPLRKRKDDIPLLVEHFVDKFNKAYEKNIKFIPDEAMSKLRAYNWPGNIRELENLIERASILSNSDTLSIPGFETTNQKTKQRINTVDLTMDSVMRNHILQVLEESQWKISGAKGASGVLGLKPSTLRDKMNKLGIKKPD
ncbi:PAS domain S-box protein [Olleya namhaensis]|uniref:PAS domain S-box protein n=1 Tax=Olleya namhaensis TaxID=1144750 RepID=UPI00232D4A19|nr:PAS domain S-box protein [Olleya namhaensis]